MRAHMLVNLTLHLTSLWQSLLPLRMRGSRLAEVRRLVFNKRAGTECLRPERLTDEFVMDHCFVIMLRLDPFSMMTDARPFLYTHVR